MFKPGYAIVYVPGGEIRDMSGDTCEWVVAYRPKDDVPEVFVSAFHSPLEAAIEVVSLHSRGASHESITIERLEP